jgi:hypothetical protein
MTRKEYDENREFLLNPNWEPWGKRNKILNNLMMQVPIAYIQILTIDGTWNDFIPRLFFEGCVYRINPNWSGPVLESPKYIDIVPCLDEKNKEGFIVHCPTGHDMSLVNMRIGHFGCIGFIYNNKLYPELQHKIIKDGDKHLGYTLNIPAAIRFIKQ